MGIRKQFSREFKLSVLRELEVKRLAEVCREHDLSSATVCGWKRDYAKSPEDAFSGHGQLWKEDAKVAEYERLVGRLYAEIDLLKKSYELVRKRLSEERRIKERSVK